MGRSRPHLPGVYGGGETPEAAISDAISAAREWAVHVTGKGADIPAPRPMTDFLDELGEGEATVMVPLLLRSVDVDKSA